MPPYDSGIVCVSEHVNWVTCFPEASARISGSRVRRPVKRALFTVHHSFIGRPTGHGPTLRAAGHSAGDDTLLTADYSVVTWPCTASRLVAAVAGRYRPGTGVDHGWEGVA
jgi:hypothetical protein